MRGRILGLGAALGLAATTACPSGALAADPKEPPKCAAIAFRSIPSGMTDGEQDAGLYKSRFGKVEVRATVKQGEAQNYYVVVIGKPLAPLAAVPKSSESCATQKKMSAPAKATDACTGQRFTTVIDSSQKQKTILLYALQGRDWKFCRAGTV